MPWPCGKGHSRERMRVGGTYLNREKGGMILYMRPRGSVKPCGKANSRGRMRVGGTYLIRLGLGLALYL